MDDTSDLSKKIADQLGEDCSRLGLEGRYWILLDDILKETLDKESLDKKCFIKYMRKLPKDSKYEDFDEATQSIFNGSKYATWRKDDGDDRRLNSTDHAETIICCAAFLHGKSLEKHLADYLHQYVYVEKVSLNAVKEKHDLADTLIRKYHRLKRTTLYSDKFGAVIDAHLSAPDYYERHGILKEIENFIQRNNKGFIKIEGGAGSGKSSIISAATMHHFEKSGRKIRKIWHFNSLIKGVNSTSDFIVSLYECLGDLFDLSEFQSNFDRVQRLEKGQASFIHDLLHSIKQDELIANPLLIIVDALDEIDKNDPISSLGIGNKLGIPDKLPDNVFFLISSRDFEAQCDYQGEPLGIDLSDKSDGSFQRLDIERFLRKKFKNERVKSWVDAQKWSNPDNIENEFVDKFCESSGYIFVYLFHVFNDIEKHELNDLPPGLEGYYDKEYKRLLSANIGGLDVDVLSKRVLAAITNFQPDVSVDRVAYYCGESPELISSLIQDWLRLKLVVEDWEEEDRYIRFFHLSFYEYLSDIKKYRAARELLEARKSTGLYRNLSIGLCSDFSFNDEDIRFNFSSDRKKSELLRLIFPALKNSSRIKELEILQSLLTSNSFCNLFVKNSEMPEKGMATIVEYLEVAYYAFINGGYAEKATDILIGFIEFVSVREGANGRKPAVPRSEVERVFHTRTRTDSLILKEYNELCAKQSHPRFQYNSKSMRYERT